MCVYNNYIYIYINVYTCRITHHATCDETLADEVSRSIIPSADIIQKEKTVFEQYMVSMTIICAKLQIALLQSKKGLQHHSIQYHFILAEQDGIKMTTMSYVLKWHLLFCSVCHFLHVALYCIIYTQRSSGWQHTSARRHVLVHSFFYFTRFQSSEPFELSCTSCVMTLNNIHKYDSSLEVFVDSGLGCIVM